MTVTATLKRDGWDNISIPIKDEPGTPLISRSFGKPNQSFRTNGTLNPRMTQDRWAGQETITIQTQFVGADAYDKAARLADLIKSHSSGNKTELDVPLSDFDTDIQVFPAPTDGALTVTYPSGATDWVGIELSLVRIDSLLGGEVSDQRAETPTVTGDGPIEFTDGTTGVPIIDGVEVQRSVGRPNADVRGQTPSKYPTVVDHRKSAHDSFSLTYTQVDTPQSNVSDLLDILTTRQGRSAYTLKFNGKFGLGAFDVFPDGSEAMRYVSIAGRDVGGEMSVPQLNLRRVYQ